MTVNVDNKVETPLPQENIDTNITQQNVDPNVNQAQENVSEDSKEDPNWKAFREARKKDRIEKEAAQKREAEALRRAEEKAAEADALKAAMEAAFAKGNNTSSYDPYGQEESEDERIQKKVEAAIRAREIEEDRKREQREHQEYPQRLVKTYPDFNNLVNEENLDYLEFHFPEVARPLKRGNDGYDKWSDIYLAIRKFVPNAVGAKRDAARAENNFSKPRSISSTGMTPTGEGISSARLSEDRKRSNWERMQKTLKGLS